MFLDLLRVLLWVLFGLLVYLLLARFIPKLFLAILGGVILLTIIAIAFYNPTNSLVIPTWEILSFPFKPLGFSLILLILGIFQIKKDHISSSGKTFTLIALLILLLSSLPIVSSQLAQQMEEDVLQDSLLFTAKIDCTPPVVEEFLLDCLSTTLDLPPPNLLQIEPLSAIVVLGHDLLKVGQQTTQIFISNGNIYLPITQIGDRLLSATQLYQQQLLLGENPFVIVPLPPHLEGEIQNITIFLERLGIPPSQILVDLKGLNLRQSAQISEEILTDRNPLQKPVALIASGMSLQRAKLTFENLGLRGIPLPTDLQGRITRNGTKSPLTIQDFLPSVTALQTTTNVVNEFLGSVYYFLRGWLSPSA